jgi:hypothetical protein
MTDRIRTLTVILEKDTREDDLADLRTAIGQIRGVASTHLGQPVDISDIIARESAKRELGQKILAVVFPDTFGKQGG